MKEDKLPDRNLAPSKTAPLAGWPKRDESAKKGGETLAEFIDIRKGCGSVQEIKDSRKELDPDDQQID